MFNSLEHAIQLTSVIKARCDSSKLALDSSVCQMEPLINAMFRRYYAQSSVMDDYVGMFFRSL